MIAPLYEHQRKIIEDNKRWTGLFLGTGSSKTRTALEMAEGKTLVICPKTLRDDNTWENNMEKFGIFLDITIISKEEFRRDWQKHTLIPYRTVIVDEAHYFFSGVSPETKTRNGVLVPRKSKLFESLYTFTRKVMPEKFYTLTATPASKPMNVWAIATLFGARWDFFQFRDKYYIKKKKGYREFYIPNNSKHLKEKLAEIVKRFGYVGQLSDYFDVPEQTYKTMYLGLTKAQIEALKTLDKEESDPMAKRAKQRIIENGVVYGTTIVSLDHKTDKMIRSSKKFDSEKIDYILERAEEFPKMLIFANYKAQIEAIKEALEKEGKLVLTLTGETTHRRELMELAECKDSVYVIAQSSISEGYELPSFPVTIYASLSSKVRDKIQGDGRTLRSNALKKNLYITLVIKNGLDELCYKSIQAGEDFQELIIS